MFKRCCGDFSRYFYTYEPLRSLDEIARDILTLEAETDGILQQVVSFEG
jgi:type I restriction enzyme M protein